MLQWVMRRDSGTARGLDEAMLGGGKNNRSGLGTTTSALLTSHSSLLHLSVDTAATTTGMEADPRLHFPHPPWGSSRGSFCARQVTRRAFALTCTKCTCCAEFYFDNSYRARDKRPEAFKPPFRQLHVWDGTQSPTNSLF